MTLPERLALLSLLLAVGLGACALLHAQRESAIPREHPARLGGAP